jgi:hypothetical protein
MMDAELKRYLDQKFAESEARIDRKFVESEARIDQKFVESEARLTERMRDMQTELLRGFAAFSQAQTIRLRKVEADQSNLDTALSGRVSVLEGRLLEIELRLGLVGNS